MAWLATQPAIVVALLVLAGGIITAAAAVAGALIAGRANRAVAAQNAETSRLGSEATERASFLQTIEANVEGMRRRAVSYEERIDALTARLDKNQQDIADCLEQRRILSGQVVALQQDLDQARATTVTLQAQLTATNARAESLQKRVDTLESRHQP